MISLQSSHINLIRKIKNLIAQSIFAQHLGKLILKESQNQNLKLLQKLLENLFNESMKEVILPIENEAPSILILPYLRI